MSFVMIGCSLIITMLLPKFMWVYVFPYLARKSFEGPQMMKGVNGHGTPRGGVHLSLKIKNHVYSNIL